MVEDQSGADAEALWYVGPGRAEIRRETLGEPGPGEVRVRALYSAISRGTERLVFAGRVPETEFERMRAPFMGGAFPFPVKYGYATVGRVERGPAELRDRIVFALHPHQSVFNLPAEAVLPIPDGVPPARAVLAANMETALNAVWDAAPAPADKIAVVGAGVVGALVAWLCGRIPGARVTLVDIEPSRAGLARYARRGLRRARRGAARLRSRRPRQRDRGGSCDRARPRRRRGDGARAELAWRRRGRGPARRSVSQPPPQARLQPGRPRRAIASGALDASAVAWRPRSICSRIRGSTR